MSKMPPNVQEALKKFRDGKITKKQLDSIASGEARSFKNAAGRNVPNVEVRAGKTPRLLPKTRGRFTLKDAMDMSSSGECGKRGATGPNAFICESDLKIWLDEGLIDGVE
jgi:hypothetical protein